MFTTTLSQLRKSKTHEQVASHKYRLSAHLSQHLRIPHLRRYLANGRCIRPLGRPDELAGFVRALIKAEAFIKSNPEAAMLALEKASEGLLSKEVIKTKFAEAEYEIGLSNGLLDILETQAKWVVGKGMVKAKPSRELIKKYLATGPMKAVDPSRISLK